MKNRILSLFLAVLMFASVFAVFPPIEVSAAKSNNEASCTSGKCTGTCKAECTFDPRSTLGCGAKETMTMAWGKSLSFSGEVKSSSTKKEGIWKKKIL